LFEYYNFVCYDYFVINKLKVIVFIWFHYQKENILPREKEKEYLAKEKHFQV